MLGGEVDVMPVKKGAFSSAIGRQFVVYRQMQIYFDGLVISDASTAGSLYCVVS